MGADAKYIRANNPHAAAATPSPSPVASGMPSPTPSTTPSPALGTKRSRSRSPISRASSVAPAAKPATVAAALSPVTDAHDPASSALPVSAFTRPPHVVADEAATLAAAQMRMHLATAYMAATTAGSPLSPLLLAPGAAAPTLSPPPMINDGALDEDVDLDFDEDEPGAKRACARPATTSVTAPLAPISPPMSTHGTSSAPNSPLALPGSAMDMDWDMDLDWPLGGGLELDPLARLADGDMFAPAVEHGRTRAAALARTTRTARKFAAPAVGQHAYATRRALMQPSFAHEFEQQAMAAPHAIVIADEASTVTDDANTFLDLWVNGAWDSDDDDADDDAMDIIGMSLKIGHKRQGSVGSVKDLRVETSPEPTMVEEPAAPSGGQQCCLLRSLSDDTCALNLDDVCWGMNFPSVQPLPPNDAMVVDQAAL
ncbi:hypothetical protein, variant [Allomyces macrogynus ATCC 38327]|nr:hypothetical protein, variant [Allomyces macrogynus ATCC 38327]|eukprot:KNE54845.1 hypothetical protein, variant [Allomyces macrogynus ATCC 38327]